MGRPRPWQLHYTYPTTGQAGVVAFAEQEGAERQAREILASASARGLPVVLTTGHRDQGVKAQHAADVNAVRVRREARPGSLPYGMTLDVFVSVPNPDDPHDWPIFEGPAREAGSRLIAGSYAANIDDVEGPDDADPVAITLHVDDNGTVSIFLADEQPDSDPA